MEKRKISISVGTVIISILFLIIFYAVVEFLTPLLSELWRNKDEIYNAFFGGKATVSQMVNPEVKIISYEEKLELMEKFPNVDFNVKVYYTIYGKRVMEDDKILNLSDVKIDKDLANYLELLSNIKEVNLYNQELTKEEKIVLQNKFTDKKFKWKVDVLNEELDCDIETLDLSNKKIEDLEDFKKSLKLLPNLKKLDMSNTNLTNEQLGDLRTLFPNIKIDWVVHLGKWSLRTDAVAFSVLIYQYDYRRMTSADIQVLKYCTDLKALDLGHQAIEDISVIGDYLPELRVLILADNQIKDISPIAKLKHLHYLELFMNNITDSTPLAQCKELVDLNISFNYRFSNIDGIMDLPLLERLWLISDNISADSYNKIRERYPNVKLVTTGSGSTNSGWRTHERYFAMIDMYRNNYISESFLKYDNK